MELTVQEKSLFSRAVKIHLAQRSFWDFCKVKEPLFYKDSRPHLRKLCDALNNFYFGLPLDASGKIYKKLMIQEPPQHGKTRTLINWCQWVLGINNEERIITGSYNEELAGVFGRYTRDAIDETKNIQDQIVFNDIFSDAKLKYGNKSWYRWALSGQHFNFLATSPGGTATGFGATIKLIDDLVKNLEEAMNETPLERTYRGVMWTLGTRNDSESGGETLEIMCATSWTKKDPCNRRLKEELGEWFLLRMPAYNQETGEMLCPDFLTKESYFKKRKAAFKNPVTKSTFLANYDQELVDIEGCLYKNFKTYTEFPMDANGNLVFDRFGAYVDTADEGSDYLACGLYLEYKKIAYLFDVYYTKDGMEKTEPETARRFKQFKVNEAWVESNSGGRGFARNVQRILDETHKTKHTKVRWFHQSKNKKSRIFSQSANVMENVLMPADWAQRWPIFFEDVTGYQKEGKNQHDDGPDMLTGIVEKMEAGQLEFGG